MRTILVDSRWDTMLNHRKLVNGLTYMAHERMIEVLEVKKVSASEVPKSPYPSNTDGKRAFAFCWLPL